MKPLEFLSLSHMKLIADKRVLSGIIAMAIAIVSAVGYFGYREFVKRWTVPTVSGTNFSLEYRKIPFDTKSIDITFSTDIDGTSLTKKNITLSPFIEGRPTLKDKNTVSYVLDKHLVVGETYTFVIGSDIRSVY